MEFLNAPSRAALAWRGLANVLMGAVLLVWPQATAYVVIALFALNLILVGLFCILEPLFRKDNPHVWATISLGVLGVTFGVYLIIKPEFAAGLVGLMIALWAILYGAFDIAVSTKLFKDKLHFGWSYLLVGIVSLLFGVYMLLSPVEGVLTIVWLFGLYSVTVGAILLMASILMNIKVTAPKNIRRKSNARSKK